MRGHRTGVFCLGVSANNMMLASGGKDSDIFIYDLVSYAGKSFWKGLSPFIFHFTTFLMSTQQFASCADTKTWSRVLPFSSAKNANSLSLVRKTRYLRCAIPRSLAIILIHPHRVNVPIRTCLFTERFINTIFVHTPFCRCGRSTHRSAFRPSRAIGAR